jgi:nucleoside-triphosphatase
MKPFRVAVTGPPGVGKTTLVKSLCKSLENTTSEFVGFYTDEVRDAHSGRRCGFDVVKFTGERCPLARVGGSGPHVVGQYVVDVTRFEKFALDELTRGASVVVIDEVGKMECLSRAFQDAVRQLLKVDY